jgi:hypothetical protein
MRACVGLVQKVKDLPTASSHRASMGRLRCDFVESVAITSCKFFRRFYVCPCSASLFGRLPLERFECPTTAATLSRALPVLPLWEIPRAVFCLSVAVILSFAACRSSGSSVRPVLENRANLPSFWSSVSPLYDLTSSGCLVVRAY